MEESDKQDQMPVGNEADSGGIPVTSLSFLSEINPDFWETGFA